jgi:trimeric autotransporter adhesin
MEQAAGALDDATCRVVAEHSHMISELI